MSVSSEAHHLTIPGVVSNSYIGSKRLSPTSKTSTSARCSAGARRSGRSA